MFLFRRPVQYIEESNVYLCFVVSRLKGVLGSRKARLGGEGGGERVLRVQESEVGGGEGGGERVLRVQESEVGGGGGGEREL